MTTLTFDLSELDEELGDLLAHRWSVRLFGEYADEEQRVIAPPSSETELTYAWTAEGSATGFVVLCDAQVVKRWTFDPVMSFRPGDRLRLTLRLAT